MNIRTLLLPCLVLAQAGHAQQTTPAPDSVIIAAAAAVVRSADACAAVWPGYWHPGKAFGFSRQADSSVFVHVPGEAPQPYELVRDRGAPPGLYRRRGYPEGFGGIDLHFQVGALSFPVVHAYTATQHAFIELLYHEAFHGHQWEHFTRLGRPAFGSNLAPVALEGTPAAFEALAAAERQALDAALAGPADSLRSRVRAYLEIRARRAALAPGVQDVEQHEEQTEGTAEYVGQRCTALAIGAGDAWVRESIRHQLTEDRPALLGGRPSKWRAYGVGGSISLLLDDLGMEGWQAAVAAGEPLDVLLQRAVEARR